MKTGRFYINNTLLVNKLKRKGGRLKTDTDYSSVVFNTGYGEISVGYSIERDEGENPLTMLDFLILDTAYLIYKDYEKYRNTFTVRQLIHAIMGTNQPSSKEKAERFAKEIEKLRHTRITINYEAEAREKNADDEGYIENEPLLPLEKIGKSKYKFIEKPPLYRYAEINSQVISVPERLYYCGNTVRNTERNFLIKYALLHELEVMRFVTTGRNKYNKKYSKDSIMYFEKSDRRSEPDGGLLTEIDWCIDENESDTIKSESEIEEKLSTVAGLHTINDITETVKRVLDYYVIIGYIEGYEILRRNRKGAVTGIKIKGEIKYPDSTRSRTDP